MLDLEIVIPPEYGDALYVVTLAEMKTHLRIVHNKLDDVITAAIIDAVDILGGVGGILNRTILPTRYRRYLSNFPAPVNGVRQPILLPYAPVFGVESITVGSDPALAPSGYVWNNINMIGQISYNTAWPLVTSGNRAIAVEYDAGFSATGDDYPPTLKRFVKLLAAHYVENGEGTINEPRQMMINRAIEFGFKQLTASLRVPVSYDDWGS